MCHRCACVCLAGRGAWCAACRLVQRPRTSHCPLCNSCIHVRDHHCLWCAALSPPPHSHRLALLSHLTCRRAATLELSPTVRIHSRVQSPPRARAECQVRSYKESPRESASMLIVDPSCACGCVASRRVALRAVALHLLNGSTY